MPSNPNSHFDHYEILAPLGKGGMGEVLRARDTQLDREVAIKVLPAEFAQDADRLRRFEQEAKATSALNHPNILTVYGFGTHEGQPYLVMELLDGEELRAQLDTGALAPRKAVDYSQQIVAGLAAAHAKGIVHRDLKPENLFVTSDGRVKILDFGLAKLRPPRNVSAGSDVATAKQYTNPGTVMGTVAYMSPEQVRGQDLDHRSDLFSFGIILHEMLSGQRTFTGESQVEVMNAILKEDPPELHETNAKISPALDRIVRRCLEKKPERRFQTASDLGFALEALSTPISSGANRTEAVQPLATATSTQRSGWRDYRLWMGAASVLSLLALLALGMAYFRRPVLDAEPMRFTITPPDKATRFDWPLISPDGRTLAFVATVEGKTQLWVRPINSTLAKPLVEVSNTINWPCWSPDSRALAFLDDGKLKKISLTGGTAEILGEVNGAGGSAWSKDGVILYGAGRRGFKRISANGGASTDVTTVDGARGERNHLAPVFLPDGKHFLFYLVHNDLAKSGVYLASLEGGESRLLFATDSRTFGVALTPTNQEEGWLVFVRQETLLAQPFDFRRNQLVGERLQIPGQVRVDGFGTARLSLALNGTLVMLEGSAKEQLVWLDRTGKRIGTVGQPGIYLGAEFSPDEQRLVVEKRDPQTQTSDLFVWDLARGAETRFTFDPANDAFMLWSPDGSRIVWSSPREGPANLYWKAASGAGQDELLYKSAYSKFPVSWSADGKFLLYREANPQTSLDLWVLPMEGERQPWPWLTTPFSEPVGQFSPNGKWIAYMSNESGHNEIYAQAFVPGQPASGSKVQLSTNGGTAPQWRRDGRELYYRSLDGKLMAVDVTLGTEVKVGTPHELFAVAGYTNLTATNDGQRFLAGASIADTAVPPFTVVLNWMAEGKK